MTTEIDELKNDISALAKTLILTSIILTTLFILTSCSLFGTANPHTEILTIPPDVVEGNVIEGITDDTDTTLIITPSTWFANVS